MKNDYTNSLAALCLAVQLSACGGLDEEASVALSGPGSATISWTAPGTREDDIPLLPNEIGGFRVYYGAAEGDYIREIDVISDGTMVNGTVTVEGLPIGITVYFVVTTYDNEGRESLYSPEVEVPINI